MNNKLYDSENILFLKPYFDDNKPWGGSKLRKYGYVDKSNIIGEAYLISGIKNKSSFILNSNIVNNNLYDFYLNNKEWFNNYKTNRYPLISKLIDANDDLSIQVHPDDKYAKSKFNEFGKYECWYILDCLLNQKVVCGLKVNNLNELKENINLNKWNNILNEFLINKNDVIKIKPGVIHAIKGGTFLFEIQQASELTFRLYDYNRLDCNHQLRRLDYEDAFNVINFSIKPKIEKLIDNKIMDDNQLFKTEIYELNNSSFDYKNINDNFSWLEMVIFNLNNAYIVDNYSNKKYDLDYGISLIIKNNLDFSIVGTIKFAITYIKKG